MLWWGVDETLAELLACHTDSSGFEGNPMGRFTVEIKDERFRPNRAPAKIGLFGGRYTIVFQPCEFFACPCMCRE
jgi:hypothetical protein